jgi:hypothetical protein
MSLINAKLCHPFATNFTWIIPFETRVFKAPPHLAGHYTPQLNFKGSKLAALWSRKHFEVLPAA